MPPEPDPQSEAALAEALEDYHRKAAMGEPAARQSFADRLGPLFPEFEAVLDAEQALDAAMTDPHEAEAGLPRPLGPYTLIRELGRGGVGVVYEAVDRRLGRSVALKVLKVSFEDDPIALERFRREAAACARVRHDHIVAIFEAGEIEGQPYYAMDIVPGEPLEAALRAGRAPKARDLCRELANVADALQALHDAGIVHRDVKPPNLMVRPDGRLVLTDFGLARTQGSMKLTRTGAAVGTPLYMSPEQIIGTQDSIDARTDVYGLGTVLYETLTGRPPFDTHEMPRLLYMIATQRPDPLRSVNPTVPEACERMTLKALEKEPADRYASASAMAADLRAFADDRTVVGHPLTRTVRAARWARRRWLPLAAAVLVICVGLWAWGRRPAKYVIEFGTPADLTVRIDTEEHGHTPVTALLTPGEHFVHLERKLFEPKTMRIQLSAGADKSDFAFMSPLKTLGTEDRSRALAILNQGLLEAAPALEGTELPDDSPAAVSGTRGGQALPPLVLLPRGRMRARDLVSWWVEVDLEYEVLGGRLELRRGETPLWSQELIPRELQRAGERAWACGSLPVELAAQVNAGDNLTLTWTPPAGHETVPAQTVAIQIVTPGAQTARALESLAALPVPAPWDIHYRVEILRRGGLYAAALLEAATLAASPAADYRTWGSVLRIVRDDLGLHDALLVDELDKWLSHDRTSPPPQLCVRAR